MAARGPIGAACWAPSFFGPDAAGKPPIAEHSDLTGVVHCALRCNYISHSRISAR